ncbi:MAG: DUF1543 domain-containing protein [Bdellovibrionaceae bacterium]|nr:DUF1543 domain-containing protein [Bacteriovoracaceae bacterium]MCK6597773.1 DUF1543 domain-containing protein [Pseudobdellovibrionaceae bacterium]NUM57934.1 DUF1543 domain-containing protein [Pseudobdellovibrionaceae bacterium]
MKPFALLLGGSHPRALLELHDICFVMAENETDAFRAVVNKWFGDAKSAHVDAWIDLSIIDGHKVNLESNPSGKQLFFVNIGYYQKGVFREEHQHLFYVCSSLQEAKTRALTEWQSKTSLSHIDNLVDIDSLIEITHINRFKLGWEKELDLPDSVVNVGYWPLNKYR